MLAFPQAQQVQLGAQNEGAPARRSALERAHTLIEPLSEREREVLRLLAASHSNQDIAGDLMIAVGTVKRHVHSIFGKLGVANRLEAVNRARELGLLSA